MRTIRDDLHPHTQRGQMIRSAAGAGTLKAASIGLAFLASLLYARTLGSHGYGAYAYVMAWATILTVPAGLGLSQYIVRQGSWHPDSSHWLMRWAIRRVWIAGAGAAAIVLLASLIPVRDGDPYLFLLAAPIPLLFNLTAVRSALLQLRGHIVASQWPQMVLAPALTLMSLCVIWLIEGRLSGHLVLAATTGAALVNVFVTSALAQRSQRGIGADEPTDADTARALPFMWIGMLYLLNGRIDLIMLGTLDGAQAAGVYSVASRIAELVTFVLLASNMVIAPRIARLHKGGERVKLQRLLTGASRRVAAATLPVAAAFVLLAHPLLKALYGPEFAAGAIVLQILALAQLFNVFAGPTAVLLNMTGQERLTTMGVAVSVIVNLILNVVLIPRFGATGAAIATGTSLVIWNVLLWYWIRRYLSLRPSAMGF